jgi:hypothetical protein
MFLTSYHNHYCSGDIIKHEKAKGVLGMVVGHLSQENNYFSLNPRGVNATTFDFKVIGRMSNMILWS